MSRNNRVAREIRDRLILLTDSGQTILEGLLSIASSTQTQPQTRAQILIKLLEYVAGKPSTTVAQISTKLDKPPSGDVVDITDPEIQAQLKKAGLLP